MNIEPRIHIDGQGPLMPGWQTLPDSAYRADREGRPFVGLAATLTALSTCVWEAFAERPDLTWHNWTWRAYLGLYRPGEPGDPLPHHLVGHNTCVAGRHIDVGIAGKRWTTSKRFACAANSWMWTTNYGPGNVLGVLATLEHYEVTNRFLVEELAGGTVLTWIDLQTGELVQRNVQLDVEPPSG